MRFLRRTRPAPPPAPARVDYRCAWAGHSYTRSGRVFLCVCGDTVTRDDAAEARTEATR